MDEDRIGISVQLRDRVIDAVDILSRRRLQACQLFHGRDAATVQQMLPLLYHICAQAHGLAARLALARAAGKPAELDNLSLLPLLIETCEEHLRRILLDWPALCGGQAQIATLGRLREGLARLRQAVAAQDRQALPGLLDDVADELREAFANLDKLPVAAFGDWLADTAVAELLIEVVQQGLADYGRSDIGPLSLVQLDLAALEQLLAADNDGQFVRAPHCHQQVFDTGPLARQYQQPLIQSLRQAHGNGLLPRLAATLLECLLLPARMRALLDGGDDDELVRIGDSPAGSALVVVEAARGCLAHRVEMHDGLVSRYQILAPTEWNFHPQGLLVQGLCGRAEAGGEAALRDKLRLMSTALDPCVAFDIEVHAHA